MNRRNPPSQASHEFVVPFDVVNPRIADDTDTEQHKALRGKQLRKRSIREYRHATSKWGAALEGFNPLWFAICISSGGLALIFNGPFPYHGRWLVVIATILYVFELVTFLLFLTISIARWVVYPHTAARRALSDPDELGAYAIPPIALMILAALTASQVSEGSWGGFGFTIVAYVLWWIGLAWVFLTLFAMLTVLIYTGLQESRTMTPVIFMAPVGLATAGTTAGFITIYSHDMSARLAVPMLIVGYFAIGVAFFMAIILYAVYFHRLMAGGWAPAAKRAGIFIMIGPCGQISTALQLLGDSAASYMRFAEYKPSSYDPPTYGTFWRQETATAIQGAGLLFALMLLGFAYVCLCLAFIGLADVFIQRKASFNLTYWAIVFPVVTMITAWLELSKSMDSPTFRVLVCIFTAFLVIVYFINLGFTAWGVLNGSLIFGKSQLELENDLVAKVQDRDTDAKESV